MPCRQLIVVDKLDMCRLSHGLLWIHQQVINRISSDHLIQPNDPLRLLPHGALKQVPGGLIMMRVRDNSRHDSNNGEGVDLHVRVLVGQFVGFKGDVAVVLFVDVQELNHAHAQQVVEG